MFIIYSMGFTITLFLSLAMASKGRKRRLAGCLSVLIASLLLAMIWPLTMAAWVIILYKNILSRD